MSNSSEYRVFADAEGFFGEEGCGWGRTPLAILTFEVADGNVGDLITIEAGVSGVRLDVREARKLLQSWL